MQLIKEIIRKKNLNQNVLIPIKSNNSCFIGDTNELNNYIQNKLPDIITPTIDKEVVKYKYNHENHTTELLFYFKGKLDYGIDGAGFTNHEINAGSSNFRKSFFVFECYDSMNQKNQKKIFTTLYTKKTNTPKIIQGVSGTYLYHNDQLTNLYIPKWFLNTINENETTLYFKIFFYNAKTGKLLTFFNQQHELSSPTEKLYFKFKINLKNNYWNFLELTLNNYLTYHLIAEEMINANLYLDKLNSTIETNLTLKQKFPIGGYVFDYKTGTYINVPYEDNISDGGSIGDNGTDGGSRHTHDNKDALDKISENDGMPYWNGYKWPSKSTDGGILVGESIFRVDYTNYHFGDKTLTIESFPSDFFKEEDNVNIKVNTAAYSTEAFSINFNTNKITWKPGVSDAGFDLEDTDLIEIEVFRKI